MSKQYNERVAYNTKTEYLRQHFQEVDATEFYNTLFPPCSFEGEKCPSDLKPNGLLTDLHHYFAWKHNELDADEQFGRCNHMIFDDHEIIAEYRDAKYVIVSPVGYFGRKPTERNSHTFFAFVLDIDDVTPDNLEQLCWGWQNNYFGDGYGSYPKPTFITNSGHGCHMYYVLKEPAPMYPQVREKLKAFKNDFLTQICCDSSKGGNTSKEEPDILQLCQGFRMVGSYSKLGKEQTGREKFNLCRSSASPDQKHRRRFFVPGKPRKRHQKSRALFLGQAAQCITKYSVFFVHCRLLFSCLHTQKDKTKGDTG